MAYYGKPSNLRVCDCHNLPVVTNPDYPKPGETPSEYADYPDRPFKCTSSSVTREHMFLFEHQTHFPRPQAPAASAPDQKLRAAGND